VDLTSSPSDAALVDLAGEVAGPEGGPVNPRGTHSRSVPPNHRVVHAPGGIIEFHPDEMVVRCGAGTRLDDLHAELAAVGHEVALPGGGSVGGALAWGRSDVMRRGRGPVRDAVLEIRWIDAWGRVIRSGGPTVKNVSGFDLCRVLVGSRGTLGVMGEVTLRTRPRPPRRSWFATVGTPDEIEPQLHRPLAVLWDGSETWVALEGHPRDVDEEARRVGLDERPGPPELPSSSRWSIAPSRWREVRGPGRFVVEIGVGVVHHERDPDPISDPLPAPLSSRMVALHHEVRLRLDPFRRFEPDVDMP
jgi:FAD/FMN-containing dehydrogenase